MFVYDEGQVHADSWSAPDDENYFIKSALVIKYTKKLEDSSNNERTRQQQV